MYVRRHINRTKNEKFPHPIKNVWEWATTSKTKSNEKCLACTKSARKWYVNYKLWCNMCALIWIQIQARATNEWVQFDSLTFIFIRFVWSFVLSLLVRFFLRIFVSLVLVTENSSFRNSRRHHFTTKWWQ